MPIVTTDLLEAEQDTPTACRLCIEFQCFLEAAQQPASPELLLGLSEAGERNRLHQRQENIFKAEMNLQRHKKVCPNSKEQL